MRFEDAVEVVLDLEGGTVNHPEDQGGLTKWGISLAAFPELGREGVLALSREDAARIYRVHYWNPVCPDVPELLRLAVFDAAVHHGLSQSIKLLQRALNFFKAGLAVDAIIGPATRRALLSIVPGDVLIQLQRERQRFMRSLPNYKDFSEGWEKRVLRITFESPR